MKILKIILLLILSSFTCCEEFSEHSGQSAENQIIQYCLIDSIQNKPELITMVVESYNTDNEDFTRYSYSIERGLLVEYEINGNGFLWHPFENFKQKANVKSTFKQFNVPKNEKEAHLNNFGLRKKDENSSLYCKENEKGLMEIKFYKNGDVVINAARNKIGNNDFRVFEGIKKASSQTEAGKTKSEELKRLRDLAEKGESSSLESQRLMEKNGVNNILKFKGLIKEIVFEIAENHPDYELGLVDIGRFFISYENNTEKAEYYLKKALNLNPKSAQAYAYLQLLYIFNKDPVKLESIHSEMKKNLDKKKFFLSKRILALSLSSINQKTDALKIIEDLKNSNEFGDFKKDIEELKTLIEGKPIMRVQ